MNPDLDLLYFPNKWTKRLSPDEISDEHIKIVTKESEKARSLINCDLDVPYGDLEKEKIDIFGTDLNSKAPVVVFIHGGYWQKENYRRDTYHYIAANLHKNGIKTIFVGYELCPKVALKKIVEEIEVATLKCIEYAKNHGSKGLHLVGFSAGAHLVAILFTEFIQKLPKIDRETIKSAVLISGIYDLSEIPKTSVNLALKLTENEAKELSPLKRDLVAESFFSLKRDLVAESFFYVISAENDSPVFKKQAKDFYLKLLASGIEARELLVADVDHFNIIERLLDEDYEISGILTDLCASK